MPALVQRNAARSGNATAMMCSPSVSAAGSAPAKGIWSKRRDDVGFEQLQKFWSELSPRARRELLRIDKQMLFEQARKNLYCSRCNGLLLEGFSQIVMYGKSLQQEGGGAPIDYKAGTLINGTDNELDDMQDPSVHPWGGLVSSRDGSLTLMDCYLHGKSLLALQNVFNSARAREHERELLYPDACGGGGRGWISHGMSNYGRAHGTRESCALHTARLSCDTLVDFWSALGDETRLSLLRMKEEDFIERLMYRFDSKRFCRDCRRNVIKEFKELKELKRIRRETRCTSWFCVADTAFQYEVSDDTVQADWHQSFADTVGTYHHFEWAIGTGEGKSDVLDFEDVGMSGEVHVDGLDLSDLDACFITLRAWRLDGRCTELSVKAHALKGQPCVHRRLVIGDGFITITKGESIRRFFEHAEEAEEEEEEDAVDKDGNELDSDGSRPQKHAKSPELAREFLLDAATVIFKEQVEKAFREGTARQNAHSTFVCLALKLLEERVHVACKEIITLEKQTKLLEEEEREKREEEERKERRRMKDREKKLRRKERLKEKEREKERKDNESDESVATKSISQNEPVSDTQEELPSIADSVNSNGEGENNHSRPPSPHCVDKKSPRESLGSKSFDPESDCAQQTHVDREIDESGNTSDSFMLEQSKSARRKLRLKQDFLVDKDPRQSGNYQSHLDNFVSVHHSGSVIKANVHKFTSSRCINGVNRNSRASVQRTNGRNCLTSGDKFHHSKIRLQDEHHSCNCDSQNNHGVKDGHGISVVKSEWEIRTYNKVHVTSDTSRPVHSSIKYNNGYHSTDNSVPMKGKPEIVNGHLNRISFQTKKVWEPTDARKKFLKHNPHPDDKRTNSQVDPSEEVGSAIINGNEPQSMTPAPDKNHSHENPAWRDERIKPSKEYNGSLTHNHSPGSFNQGKDHCFTKDKGDEEVNSYSVASVRAASPVNNGCDTMMSSSSSDNCSSCLSEADCGSSSSSARNTGSSSASDSEDASQHSEARDNIPDSNDSAHHSCRDLGANMANSVGVRPISRALTGSPVMSCTGDNFTSSKPAKNGYIPEQFGCNSVHRGPQVLPIHNQGYHVPYYSAPTIAYHGHGQESWSAVPSPGIMSFAQPHQYILPTPFVYGLQGNQPSEFCMQYNGLQQSTTMLNGNHFSSYQTVHGDNAGKISGQTKNPLVLKKPEVNKTCEKTGSANPIERSHVLSRQPSPGPLSSSAWGNGSVEKDRKSSDMSFSLFHFGGPVAVASGDCVDQSSVQTDTDSEKQSKKLCTKEEATVEEYSLFKSNKAIFPFF